jgi:hypothetical protein
MNAKASINYFPYEYPLSSSLQDNQRRNTTVGVKATQKISWIHYSVSLASFLRSCKDTKI